jgi:DNA polymerase III subunit gamma/tau
MVNVGTTIKIPTLAEIKAKKNEPKLENTDSIAEKTEDKKLLSGLAAKNAWEKFAEQIKNKGSINDYLILHERELIIDEENATIKITLDNQVQLDRISELKIDILGFIKKECNNFSIQIIADVAIDNTANNKNKLYTDRDKFEFLAEKYPFLNEMKKRFGLDTNAE